MPKNENAMHNHLGSFHGIGRSWWVSQRLYMQTTDN